MPIGGRSLTLVVIISSACCGIYFRNRNRIVRSRFRLFFCYGSNSGVGSYTSIISRAANRNPIVNACNSCLSEISASAFSFSFCGWSILYRKMLIDSYVYVLSVDDTYIISKIIRKYMN